MPTSTLTSKGQVTVPKEVRKHLRVAEGDRLEFSIAEDGSVRLRPVAGSVRQLLGLLHREGTPPLSISEMDQAIAGFVADEDERIRAGKR
jgi:antitoxin PrlF